MGNAAQYSGAGNASNYESQFLDQGWTHEGFTDSGLPIYEYDAGGYSQTRFVGESMQDIHGDTAQIGRDKAGMHEAYGEKYGEGSEEQQAYADMVGLEARAMGGRVRPGRGYMVGERGPEYFSPTTPGYITPNDGGKASARMIGREVAKALQESPISIPQDAVTDSVLRAAPGREALRGWA